MAIKINDCSKMEKTLVLLKPETLQRRLIGKIISRYEQKGLYVHKMKMLRAPRDLVEQHYIEHKGKNFIEPMVERLSTNSVVAMVVAGNDAVSVVRKLNGLTKPLNAELGTIRGDYGICVGRNLVHGSDSIEAAKREIKLWFGEENDEVDTFDYESIYE